MPFTLGFYDLFSYLIPGVLYLYVINEMVLFLNAHNILSIPTLVLPSETELRYATIAGFLVLAYLTGSLFEHLARWFVNGLIYRDKPSQTVLNKVKVRNSGVDIQFEAKDWHLLWTVVRQRNLAVSQTFDKYQADSIMFRNLSLIALFMAVLMGARAIVEDPLFWAAVGIAALVCMVAAQRSRLFHEWFFEGIFLAALEYGKSVNEVLAREKTQSLEHAVRFNLSRSKVGKE